MRNIFERFCISVSRFSLPSYKEKFKYLIKVSGKKHNTDFVLGLSMTIGILILIISLFIASYYPFEVKYVPFSELKNFNPQDMIKVNGELVSGVVDGFSETGFKYAVMGTALLLIILVSFGFYGYYYYIGEKRASFVDNVLPDVLSLISSNINSGLTPYHAVKSAVREEFGPLAESFQVAINKSIGKKSFQESIVEVADDFKSGSLRRSMNLFAATISTGTNIANLLKNLAKDIRERSALRSELITSTKTNSMFILFMVVVGAPMLMSIAIFFVDIVSSIMSKADVSGGASSGISLGGEIVITSGFLKIYSYVLFFLTGLIVSYFSGVVVEGDGKTGLKKAPLIIGASYIVFIISLFLVQKFLGGLF